MRKCRVKKGDDEHTQPPTSSEGINNFIDKTDDEYPNDPTSNVRCSSQRPVLSRGLGVWEFGDSRNENDKVRKWMGWDCVARNLLQKHEYSIKVEERL